MREENVMQRQLVEALTYPGLMVRQLIDASNYPHRSLYEATGERCHKCSPTGECSWARCIQDFRHLDEKSSEFLGETLREGIKLVESLHKELRHDETTCTCETCSWIRNAEHLTEECEHHLPHVEPAIILQASGESAAK